jgi:copper chaperone CopZ
MVAINAARAADDGKANFELPVGSSFKCQGCAKAISAALRKVDAQRGIEQYSPAKKQIQSREGNEGVVGGLLINRRGSTGSRKSLRQFSRQDDETVEGAVRVLMRRHQGGRTGRRG